MDNLLKAWESMDLIKFLLKSLWNMTSMNIMQREMSWPRIVINIKSNLQSLQIR